MVKQTIMRTQRHETGKARITVFHEKGIVDIIVSAGGSEDPMTDDHVVEALRSAVVALDAVGAHIEQHVDDHGY